MACEFKDLRRVEWADTDAARIIHFSTYFFWMEQTEHAFWRSLGLTINMDDRQLGWPRVHAECDFKFPPRFEDEIEVHLLVREKKEKALTYDFIFRKVNGEPQLEVARGTMTIVCVARDGAGKMMAVPIPPDIAEKFEVAPSTANG